MQVLQLRLSQRTRQTSLLINGTIECRALPPSRQKKVARMGHGNLWTRGPVHFSRNAQTRVKMLRMTETMGHGLAQFRAFSLLLSGSAVRIDSWLPRAKRRFLNFPPAQASLARPDSLPFWLCLLCSFCARSSHGAHGMPWSIFSFSERKVALAIQK